MITGHNLSGEVKVLGAGVNGFKVGDEDYGVNDWFTNGTQPRAVFRGAFSAWNGPARFNFQNSVHSVRFSAINPPDVEVPV